MHPNSPKLAQTRSSQTLPVDLTQASSSEIAPEAH